MQLQINHPAPSVQTRDVFDQPINLGGTATHWTLISFLRNGACVMCNLRIHQMIAQYSELKVLGLKMIAVFESPVPSIVQNVTKQNVPFVLLSDPEAKLYELYGVEISEEKIALTMQMPETQIAIQSAASIGYALTPEEGSNFYRIPADFLIDPQGNLRIVHYANHLTDHISFEDIRSNLLEPKLM